MSEVIETKMGEFKLLGGRKNGSYRQHSGGPAVYYGR